MPTWTRRCCTGREASGGNRNCVAQRCAWPVPHPRSGGGGPPKAVEGANAGRGACICPLHHALHGPPPPSQATGEEPSVRLLQKRALMAALRCALAILPAENGDPERLLASLDHAKQAGLGDFADIVPLPGLGRYYRVWLGPGALLSPREVGCSRLRHHDCRSGEHPASGGRGRVAKRPGEGRDRRARRQNPHPAPRCARTRPLPTGERRC